MLSISCAFISIALFLVGSSSNGLCIVVFLRERFRHRIVTPYFIALLVADSIYLAFRLIKLLYYSQTLFKTSSQTDGICSQSLFARFYQHATQTWPQLFIPLIHSETYIRFSLILMCFVTIQRTIIINRSLQHLNLQKSTNDRQKYRSTLIFILIAFILAYSFEFFGLTLFCSKSNDPKMFYQWFIHMSRNMKDSTTLFKRTLKTSPVAYRCVSDVLKNLKISNDTSTIFNDTFCNEDQLMEILSNSFDQHQRSIVNLIQNILYHQTGQRVTRNEIRRRFHFHECFFRQETIFFHRHYHFMYDRTIGINRYTIILVFGSILPSLLTIISNLISIHRVHRFNRVASNLISHCQRRTDDTRRVLLVITIECLMAILNTWFVDILLSFVFCKKKLAADDDCPRFLQENYHYLVLFDLFNSFSTIILHCLSGQHFRRELFSMFFSLIQLVKNCLGIHSSCFVKKIPNDNDCLYLRASISRPEKKNSSDTSEIILTIRASSKPSENHFFPFQQLLSFVSLRRTSSNKMTFEH